MTSVFPIPSCVALALTLTCVMADRLPAAEVFASPTGDDANSGSETRPFQSLQRARDEARKYAGREAVTVFLRGGRHRIGEPLELDARDSGTAAFPVAYRSYPGETAVICGGVPLVDWRPDGNVIWKAETGGREFRQLYVNRRKATRSRWPNEGDYLRLVGWDKPTQTIKLNRGAVRDWTNFNEVEIFIQMSWSISVMRLESYRDEGPHSLLTVMNPERDLVFKRQFPMKQPRQALHYENSRDFIDQPGEWAIDRAQDVCYYYPRPGEDMSSAEVVIPQVETLLAIRGTLDAPVEHVTIEGITFEHSNWLLPNERGYLNIQAGQYTVEPTINNNQYVERPPAAVVVECAHNVTFRRNVFKKLGAVGLDMHYGTRDCEVVGNVFYDIAGTGVSHAKLSDPGVEIHLPYNPADPRELSVNDRIHNNYLDTLGYEYGGAIGILSGWPVAVRIDHNELANLAYTGISVGWGWTKKPNAMRDNRIRWNHIDRPMTLYGDGGGIYTLSEMPGSLIYRNYVSNVERSAWASQASTKCYFLDEGSGGITMQENHEKAGHGIERVRLHVTGDVRFMPKSFSDYQGIIDGAGLEPAYRGIRALAVD